MWCSFAVSDSEYSNTLYPHMSAHEDKSQHLIKLNHINMQWLQQICAVPTYTGPHSTAQQRQWWSQFRPLPLQWSLQAVACLYRMDAIGYNIIYTHCEVILNTNTTKVLRKIYIPAVLVNKMGLLGWLAPIAFTAIIVTLYCTSLSIFCWEDVSKLVLSLGDGMGTSLGVTPSGLEFDEVKTTA